MRHILLFTLFFLTIESYSQAPKADFNYVVNYYCGYTFVGLENKSINADSCFWDEYGFGNYTFNNNPTIKIGNLDNDHDFKVSLIVKKDGLTDTITKSFSLRKMRVGINFKIPDSISSAPILVNFVSQTIQRDGDSLSYYWDFGDGSNSIEPNPSHIYLKNNIYYVNLKVKDNFGCEYSSKKGIYLLPSSSLPYHLFPTKNTMWMEMYYNPFPDEYSKFHCFALKDNDTVINNKLYHKLYHSTDTIFTENNLCGGIREEDKRVYFYATDSITLLDQHTFPSRKSEYILYDFSLNFGDTISADSFYLSHGDKLIVDDIDSILVGSEYRKRFTFGPPGAPFNIPWAQWVDGVGSLRGLLFATGDVPTNGLFNDLICFKQNNNIFYHYSKYDTCYYKNPDAIEKLTTGTKILIFPNPVKTTAHIEFDKPGYKKLTITDLFGRTLMGYNIEGKPSLEINRGGIWLQGLYILTIYDKQGNMQTTKVIFE
jgi:PKD repeat protein